MSRRRKLSIDLRWIDASGVGVYIKSIMPGIVEHFRDHSIVGIGTQSRISQFSWASEQHFKCVLCDAPRYSISEQIKLPLTIPRDTDLFFSPYYTFPVFYPGPIAVTVHDMSHLVVNEIVS